MQNLIAPFKASRRSFLSAALSSASLAAVGVAAELAPAETAGAASAADAADAKRMRDLAAFTALTFDTPEPVPYGASIVNTGSGELLMHAVNAVGSEHDPSAHAELRTIRLACAKLRSGSLRGNTLYTTCEPCPMCMACSLWAGLDRVVFGATIDDATHFGHQILIPAAEVAKRAQMTCAVTGPVERDVCYALFTSPKMQKTYARWNARP